MPAASLYQLARNCCVRNIKAITDVGDVPYDRVREVLLKVENPDQLRQIEIASPQICGEDAEIWMEYIKRDIPRWSEKPHQPRNPKNWYKVYRKLRRDLQAEVDRDAETLKAAMEGYYSEKTKNTSKLVDMSALPGLRKNTKMGARPSRSTATNSTSTGNPSVLSFTSGSKSKNVMQKVRREAREMSLFSAKNSKLSQPTHLLKGAASQVRAAPRALVDEHKRPAAPLNSSQNVPQILAPRLRMTSGTPHGLSLGSSTVEESEQRLKALTSRHLGGPRTKRDNPGASVPQPQPQITTSGNPASPVSPIRPTRKKPASNHEASVRPPAEKSTSTTTYKAPRLKPSASPDPRSSSSLPKRPKEVNIFMPAAKKRRVQ